MMGLDEIQERFKPEMALIILILRVYFKRIDSVAIGEFVTVNKIDWKLFNQMVTAHQVRSVIYKALAGGNSGIPVEVLAKLKEYSFEIAMSNLRNLEELARLHKLLKSNGVPNVPYKGVILSWFLFGDYVSRETSDIDFLIEPVCFSEAHELLIADGYKPRYYNPDFERQFLDTSHELLYRKKIGTGAIKIEIHWAATNKMMNIPLPNGYLFNGLQTFKISGKEIDIFTIENHLLILLVHHGVNDVWRSLRLILDVAAMIEKYGVVINWSGFKTATQKYKIRHTTEIGFLIANQLFGAEIPQGYEEKSTVPENILNNLLTYPAIKKSKLSIDNLKQHLFLRDSIKDRLTLLGNYIFAGVKPNVRDWEAVTISKKYYGLYYLVKPFRILFKKF